MANLRELTTQQINELLTAAADKQVPVTVTVRLDEHWNNLRSRVLGLDERHLLIEPPTTAPGQRPHEFAPADKIHLSFKLKHYKHMLSATVAGPAEYAGPDGPEPALSVVWPASVLRLQRRAYHRVGVPGNRIVRASFWLGGMAAEPAGTSSDHPVWSGRVTNLSAGGFQVLTERAVADALETGEVVGVRLAFGTGEETIFSDARFRHLDPLGDDALLGFQLIGLAETEPGREALRQITDKVMAFQKAEHEAAAAAR